VLEADPNHLCKRDWKRLQLFPTGLGPLREAILPLLKPYDGSLTHESIAETLRGTKSKELI
jgi:hypothetical protein